jgi:hypothetical protein
MFDIEERKIYITSDGEEFTDYEDAKAYQATLVKKTWGKGIRFFTGMGREIPFTDVITNDSKFSIIEFIVLEDVSIEDLEQLDLVFQEQGGQFLSTDVSFEEIEEERHTILAYEWRDEKWFNFSKEYTIMSEMMRTIQKGLEGKTK